MGNYFIIPLTFEYYYESNNVDKFLFKLKKLFNFVSDNQEFLNIKIYGDFSEFEALEDLELYTTKSLIDLLINNHDIYVNAKSNNLAYTYYEIGSFVGCHFRNVESNSLISAVDKLNYSDENVKYISNSISPFSLSILKILNGNPSQAPFLCTILGSSFNLIGVETFIDLVVKKIFNKDFKTFTSFKEKYLKFYSTYEWEKVNYFSDSIPAHKICKDLLSFHTNSKNISYLKIWGLIMAILNGGRYNKSLTLLNKRDKRVNYIFQFGSFQKNTIEFFTVDTENGTLEIYDYKGKHKNKIYGLQFGIRKQVRNYTIDVPRHLWLEDYTQYPNI